MEIEALIIGEEFGLVAEVPFADDGSRVAGGLEDFADGDFVRRKPDGIAGKEDARNGKGSFRVGAGHECGA